MFEKKHLKLFMNDVKNTVYAFIIKLKYLY